ncbi:unnamed protein product [Auanema sp. JU1783]|nr:unnamed protein product [Auanema sp. JU1783]
MSDRCIFCGWNRSTCYKNIKFFGLPKEPGLKRFLWMHAVRKKVIRRHDKICSIHFRQGRPTNDPSHEDFIPHLFLTPEKTSSEVLSYLENEDMKEATTSTNETKGNLFFCYVVM